MKLTLLKKLFASQIFFFTRAACILKSNNTIFAVSEIQTAQLSHPTTTSFAGLFPTVVELNLLQ